MALDLNRSEPILVDGGLATELERYGCVLDDPLWSAKILIESPDTVRQVHRDYLAAGARIIATATYQATFEGLARRGMTREEAAELMRSAVRIAEEARAAENCPDAWIAGSIGCYGAFLADGSEYRGDYALSRKELIAFHRPRLSVLAPIVDVVACETVPCLVEAEALATALREHETPAWVSFSCRNEREVSHGEPLAACVAALAEVEQVFAIGVNCVAPRLVEDLASVVADSCDKHVIVYPNSGERYDGDWCGDGLDPAAFAALARSWRDAGATLIGGCCRTTPDHIAEVARAL